MANMSQSLIQPSVPVEEPLAEAPIRSSVMSVESDWIDYNGHLNMAYYHVLFDRALDQVFARIGVDEMHVQGAHHSIFALEAHVCYLRELRAGEKVSVETIFLGHDTKRLHLFQALLNLDKDFVAATSEQVGMYVNLGSRRSAPFPAEIVARIGRPGACARPPATARPGRAADFADERGTMSEGRLTVLILGGYGTFGGRLAELLASEPELTLIIAGRSAERAAAFCARLPHGATKLALAIDRDDRFADRLAQIAPDIVVDATGPFQAYGAEPYRVVEACLACGIHYLDLADASGFVEGIAKFDQEAREPRASLFWPGRAAFPSSRPRSSRSWPVGWCGSIRSRLESRPRPMPGSARTSSAQSLRMPASLSSFGATEGRRSAMG